MILLLVVLGVREYERGGAFSLDTIQLLDGVAATDACLHHGELRCRRGVNYWPPLQYLPALALKRVGASRVDTGNDLVYLNGIAILAVLLAAWAVGRRLGGEWAALLRPQLACALNTQDRRNA